ncbi:MAG: HEPN domain-containing protein [Desulfobaccales bacterium]
MDNFEFKFNLIMEQIDEELRLKDTQIFARPISAMCEFSSRLKIKFPMFPQPLGAVPELYNELTFSSHIEEWYKSRYGNRLKVHLGPGNVALLIRGDPWLMILPRIYGAMKVACDSDMKKYINLPPVSSRNDPPICNALNNIKDFPNGLASVLTIEERKRILLFFMHCLDVLGQLEKALEKPFVKEAKADLDSSVSLIFANPPQYGLSKWASLQFIEKLIKSFLALKKLTIPRHHNLVQLVQKADDAGLGSLDSSLIETVQCTASVRYGETVVGLKESIAAHHAALDLTMKLTQEIRKLR